MAEADDGLLEEEVVFVVGGVEFNPAQHGYTAVYNYAQYFWRPYLGNTAFALWELLLSFCYGDRDTAFPSISRLARMLTNSEDSRALVTGRRRARRGNGGTPDKPSRYVGALDVLRRERLVQVMREGSGAMTSYTFRVRKTLPVLRPDQVARLCPALQRDHRIWLSRHGIKPEDYERAFAVPETAHASSPNSEPLGAAGPAAPTVAPAAQEARRGDPAACAHPVVLANASSATDTGGGVGDTGGAVRDTRGDVRDTTNHPNEEDLMNHWWRDTLNELRPQLLRSTFEMCLSRSKVQSFESGVLTLRAASPLVRDVLEHRLAPLIQRALHSNSDGQVQTVVFE